MLAEWRIAVHTANLLTCLKIWKRCYFVDNFLPGLINDIEKGKKAAEILSKFRLRIENCVINVKSAMKTFISLFAAVYTKSKCPKADATNLPGIDFDALCKVAVCSICQKPRSVKPCAGSNCNKYIHVECFQQSNFGRLPGDARKSMNARKSLNGEAVMCELCSTTTKTTSPQIPHCLTCAIHDKCTKIIDLMHCIACDVSYHKHDACIPAGSKLFSSKQLLCPNHRDGKLCIKCHKGHRQAPKCRTCSNVCHKRCMTRSELSSPLEWQCNMCQADVLTYNDIVYAKRKDVWWPARIVYDKRNTTSDKCRVNYFATDRYSICTIANLELFAKISVEEENTRSKPGENPPLDKAIRLAYLQLKRNRTPTVNKR